ncbi:MAG: hypothetical protein AAF636_08475 [Pseudomonadota bacterium]
MSLTIDMLAAGLLPGIEEPSLARSARQPIADPLWMLLRQAEFGEFQATDIGSPALVRLEGDSNTFTATRSVDAPPLRYDPRFAPLEPRAEGDPGSGVPPLSQLRVSWGLEVARILRNHGLSKVARAEFVKKFPLPDPDLSIGRGNTISPSAGHITLYSAGGVDGVKLSDAMENAHPRGLFDGLDTGLSALEIETLAAELLAWKQGLPQGAQSAWWSDDTLQAELDLIAPQGNAPQVLEAVIVDTIPSFGGPNFGGPDFGGGIILPDEVREAVADEAGSQFPGLDILLGKPRPVETTQSDVLTLDGYHGGPIHWWHLRAGPADAFFDHEVGRPAPRLDQVVVPTPIRFPGMPEPRLWSIEPPGDHYGHLDTATEDLARLVVAEFAMSGAEGWMLAPLKVPRGSVTRINDVTLRDVFGREETRLIHKGAQPSDPFDFGGISRKEGSLDALVVLPSLPLVQKGPKIEALSLRRDAGARLVWAVEERAPNAITGLANDGSAVEASRPPAPADRRAATEAAFAYRLATEVPGHWVPFMMPPSSDPTAARRLKLAALLDVARGEVPPLSGNILPNLGEIADEAIPPEGLTLERAARRVRWVGGGVRNWIGRERPYRIPGAGQSGLRYDMLLPLNGPERRPEVDPPEVSLRDVTSYAEGAPRSLSALMREESGRDQGSLIDTLTDMARKRSKD